MSQKNSNVTTLQNDDKNKNRRNLKNKYIRNTILIGSSILVFIALFLLFWKKPNEDFILNFVAAANQNNMTIVNVYEDYKNTDEFSDVNVAVKYQENEKDIAWKVECYEFSDKQYADEVFTMQLTDIQEEYKNISYVKRTKEKICITDKKTDSFVYLEKKDNFLILSKTNTQYQEEVLQFIKDAE